MVTHFKARIRKALDALLTRKNYQLISDDTLRHYIEFTNNILGEIEANAQSKTIESIVFSKDRAMQLHAFLTSYIEQVANRGKVTILYKCTNERHKKSYEELKACFKGEDFVFVEESDFRPQLIQICQASRADKIVFFVDDMIFTHAIDFATLERLNTSSSILALSRGCDMDYSVVLQKPISKPQFTDIGNGLLRFNWNFSPEFSDWTYPLGVSGYMYGRIEILAMLKSIKFKAPNSLEMAMQVYLPFYAIREGVCTNNAACVCVHANLVQSEIENPTLGTFSIEELLQLWEDGKRIEVRDFYNKPMNITQEQSYTFK